MNPNVIRPVDPQDPNMNGDMSGQGANKQSQQQNQIPNIYNLILMANNKDGVPWETMRHLLSKI